MTPFLVVGSTRALGLAFRERLGTTPSPDGVEAAVQSTWLSFPGLMARKYTRVIFARVCRRSAVHGRSSASPPAVGRYLPPVAGFGECVPACLPRIRSHSHLPMRAWILLSVAQLRVVPVPSRPFSSAEATLLSRMPFAHHKYAACLPTWILSSPHAARASTLTDASPLESLVNATSSLE